MGFLPPHELLEMQEMMLYLPGPLRWGLVMVAGLQDGPVGTKRPQFEPPHHNPHRFEPVSPKSFFYQR